MEIGKYIIQNAEVSFISTGAELTNNQIGLFTLVACFIFYCLINIMAIRKEKMKGIIKDKSKSKVYQSSQEIKLFEALRDIGIICNKQYKFDRLSFDLFFNDCQVPIDIEIDGWYWHKHRLKKDWRRDNFVASRGVEVIRFWTTWIDYDAKDCAQKVKQIINTQRKGKARIIHGRKIRKELNYMETRA